MTSGIIKKEPDPEKIYNDIFNHKNHKSNKYEHMSLYDRAAQFAPFAALTGYDEMIDEEARYVDNEITLDDNTIEILNSKLNIISDKIDNGETPIVSITYFEPDQKKKGGKYITRKVQIKKIDTIYKKLILNNKKGQSFQNETIDLNRIINL